jgi:penicillin amidase
MSRLITVINGIIGVLLIALLGAAYWYLWRPLPEVSGSFPAPVSSEITIARDALGVPHIHAANQDDLLFAQGYTTAADRLWQMDSLRRYSAGELAEVVGPAGLPVDRDSQRLRTRRVAEEIYARLNRQDRAAFAAYVRGINYYITTHHGRYSFEFAVLGYDPMPWSTVDTILVGLYMYRNLTSTWEAEIHKRSMLQAASDPAKVQLLWPVRGGIEVPPGGDVSPGGDSQEGSNAWAVSGAHTASGKPLLSNDMHLQWSLPGVWYMAQLQMPGMNVMGVTLPGVPGVISGHNDHIAWGITNTGFDVQDLYIEKLDARTGRYLFRGQVEQARLERGAIRIKGKPAEPFERWVTRHGPVFVEDENEKMALKWTAAQPDLFAFPFLDLDRARNWGEFTKALANYPGPAQNFVYADTDGNIGYHAAGKLPIRRNYYGDVPVDGSSGDYEWDGYIPFEQLPNAYNPPDGYIVTANQNPFPRNYPYHINGNFPSEYRSRQILDMLRAGKALKPDDTLRIQKDVYSAFSHFLARQIVAAVDRRKATNPNFSEAVPLLRKWDGQMDKGEAAPMIVTLAYQYFRKFIGDRAAPGKGPIYETEMSAAVIRKLLVTRPAGWFDNWDVTLERALADGLEEGRRIQGDAVAKWQFGRYLEVRIPHPIGHPLPMIGKYFDIGPVEMSGSSTSVKQTSKRVGPSMRMNADLANWDNSLLNLPIGQSGHPLSRHYKDEWDAYYNGQSFPMQFDKVDVKDSLKLTPLDSRR